MTQAVPVPMQKWQRNLVVIGWLTYGSYYLGRVNLSAALPAMETSLGLGKDALGLLGTGFFWAYAVGQLVNGQLGDLISPRRLVFVGMVASAVLNLVFGFSSAFVMLLLLWSANGYFQATGWGPILRTLSNWLSTEQKRRIATSFATSYVLGNAGSLLFAGWLVERFGWRMAFVIPSVFLLVQAAFWYVSVRDTPEEKGYVRGWTVSAETAPSFNANTLLIGLQQNMRRYWPIAMAGLFVGFCLISLNTWLPTYFVEVGDVEISQASALSALSPIAGIVGVLATSAIINRYFRGRESHGLMIALVLLSMMFLLFPYLPTRLTVITIGMMVIGALISACSSLTLSTLPIVLGEQNNTSTLAGLIGLTANIGGGLSTTIIGSILERFDWDAVFYSLATAAFCALLFLLYSVWRD